MSLERKRVLSSIHPAKILIPIFISLLFFVWVLYQDERFSLEDFAIVGDIGFYALLFSIPVLLLRDAGYVYRISAITDGEISLSGSIYTVVLWEFASAVTPSIVGGTAVAVFILMKEGVSLGRSIAFVLLTSILDNLFFVICAPLAMLFTDGVIFPLIDTAGFEWSSGLQHFFWISYLMIAGYTGLMVFALFFNPRAFKWFLLKITGFKWLRKWRGGAEKQGDEIIASSKEMKGKPRIYWVRIIAVTFVIWMARYLMINCISFSFVSLSWSDHLLVFTRQAVLWIMMLVSITPGGSGLAEMFFGSFYYDLFQEFTIASVVLWRSFSYYPYLIIGAIALPKWIHRVYFVNRGTLNRN